MASKATKKEKRGLFEDLVRFTPRNGGKSVELELSPSKWAAADEWIDGLRAQSQQVSLDANQNPVIMSSHTEGWFTTKMTNAVCLLAAQEAGIMPPSALNLESIAEMINAYEIEILDDEESSADEENPTDAAPEA